MKNSHTSIERKGTIAVLLIIGLIVAYVAVSETLSRPSGENLKPSAALEPKVAHPKHNPRSLRGKHKRRKRIHNARTRVPKRVRRRAHRADTSTKPSTERGQQLPDSKEFTTFAA